MTRVYRIYCGTDTNGHDVDGDQVARDLAAECFPNGHTIYEATGRWAGDVGVIDEATVIVEWLATDQQVSDGTAHKVVANFAGAYKREAFQESVLVMFNDVNAAFV